MAKVDLGAPTSSEPTVKWWGWLLLAAFVEMCTPARRGQKVKPWAWLLWAAVLSPFCSWLLAPPNRGRPWWTREC
jgi:hypothetical protein